MLGAFFDLAGEVDGGGDDEIGIGATNLDAREEALDVNLGGCYGLLSDLEAFTEATDFYLRKGKKLG